MAQTILQILFDDRFGGPQQRVISSAPLLRRQGCETLLVLPDRGGNAHRIASDNGLTVIGQRMLKFPRLGSVLGMARWAAALPYEIMSFYRLIRQLKPDVVNVSGAIFFAPAVAAKMAGCPLVWHLNDTLLGPSASRALGWIVRLLGDCIVAQGHALARHYGIPSGHYACIYSAVDTSRFVPHAAFDRPSPGRGGQRPIRIGLLANWARMKGIDTFLEAAAVLTQLSATPLRFVMGGAELDTQPEYADHLRRLIRQRGLGESVEHYGFVDDTPGFYRDIDILVMASSFGEACPNVILEAMSRGRPVVATDVGCTRELLEPADGARCGLIVPRNDPVAMADALAMLIDNAPLRRSLGERGRCRAVSEFSLQSYVDGHVRLYKSVGSQTGGDMQHTGADQAAS